MVNNITSGVYVGSALVSAGGKAEAVDLSKAAQALALLLQAPRDSGLSKFLKADKNHDDKLDAKEWAAVAKTFGKFKTVDANHDSSVSMDEALGPKKGQPTTFHINLGQSASKA